MYCTLYNDACLLRVNLFFWMQVSIGFSVYSWCPWLPDILVKDGRAHSSVVLKCANRKSE